MNSPVVLQSLGYDQSPHFIDRHTLTQSSPSPFSHVYRKAVKDCGLQGVYILKDPQRRTEVPIVFYCKAASESESSDIHRKVWNQDIAPFVLVETPARLRLYCGFRFGRQAASDRARGILEASIAFNEAADRLGSISANAIDCGKVWEIWGDEVTPKTRVDWVLLDNLRTLEAELRKMDMTRDLAHALIGKFVYLRYLRDRNILSNPKLAQWGLEPAQIFSRNATCKAFQEVNRQLDHWLNGAIFPFDTRTIRAAHLRLVAGVFSGDSPQGQLHLDFEAYNFAFIPIETLSVIYEQFLHAPGKGQTSRGRRAGAYYTPLPLVNYLLSELQGRRPLAEGMRVLDPSCGSGAFLVQCYRALIEKRLARGPLRPVELRDLLVHHIYGVDRDDDACQVAEMSLMLTLLDYTTPPDLRNNPRFKLPVLRGRNIFRADFFDPDSGWANASRNLSFDWLVGNPPWNEFNSRREADRHVRDWVARNSNRCPIGGNQVAEAFVWRSIPLLKTGAAAGLVLPAMTLFKKESKRFRQLFFRAVRAWCVANFANLAYVLFAGRAERPAMTVFFEAVTDEASKKRGDRDRILTFAPFVVNQRANRSTQGRSKQDTWSIAVNGAEMAEVRVSDAVGGDMLPWKLAMWGTFRDGKLIGRINKRFPSMAVFLESHGLTQPYEGFQLRDATKTEEPLAPIPELAGKLRVDFSKLKGCGRIISFPPKALSTISPHYANLRKRGGTMGLIVSKPPHIIVDASRRFAVYSDRFIAVPARKIGIAGPSGSNNLLKALSLYLSSDFVTYQQFFTTPEWGVSTSLATLEALKRLPVPLDVLSEHKLQEWADLRDALANEGVDGHAVSDKGIEEVNRRVFKVLGIAKTEQTLIEDFVCWNMQTIKGKSPRLVSASPGRQIIDAYCQTLELELDAFLGEAEPAQHAVSVLHDDLSAIIAITLATPKDASPSVFRADDQAGTVLAKTRKHLLKQHSQWLYFARDLRVYTDNTLYMLKPMERIQWTRRQAIIDAGDVIAETLEPQTT